MTLIPSSALVTPPIAQRSKTLGKVERDPLSGFEEGYLRPQFITVEEGGVNDIHRYRAIRIFIVSYQICLRAR